MNNAVKQTCLHIVKQELKRLEKNRKDVKVAVGKFWKDSSPDTEKGQGAFVALNKARNFQRRIKSRIRKLSSLAKQLKA